jgi:sRNA-binding regulator protein Hfq
MQYGKVHLSNLRWPTMEVFGLQSYPGWYWNRKSLGPKWKLILYQFCVMLNQFCVMLYQFCVMFDQFCVMLDQFCRMLDQFCVMLYQFCVMLDQFCGMLDQFCVMFDQFCVIMDQFCVILDQFCVMLDQFCVMLEQNFDTLLRWTRNMIPQKKHIIELWSINCPMWRQSEDVPKAELSS